MDKKQREKDILSLIYKVEDYAEIIESEQPDFRISHKRVNGHFGVEITEFYYSESNARLRNIPNYFKEIVDDNAHRHKDDRITLQVHEGTIMSSDGTPKGDVRGIVQELPQPQEYANMIASVIVSKSEKFNEYDQNLSHVNLIILDTEQRLQFIHNDEFSKYFFTTPLKTALYTSDFREIFLVTMLDESRKVYIPLKMLLLLAEFSIS